MQLKGDLLLSKKVVYVYLRFVRQTSMPGARSREGFFVAAYELSRNTNLDETTYNHVTELLVWFGGNLAAPKKFSRTTSKGHYRRMDTPGLSWFKPSAQLHVKKAFELKALLDEHGHAIEVLKARRPGYVVFEDRHQIVAEPFANDHWFA